MSKSGKLASRLVRCGQCAPCQSLECGMCRSCINMPKFGGPGTLKKPCEKRLCVSFALPKNPGGKRGGAGLKNNAQEMLANQDAPTERIYKDGEFFDEKGLPIEYNPLGLCAGCDGTLNEKYSINPADSNYMPVLLCDGVGCSREYHLKCAEMDNIPEGEFFCEECSVEGKSQGLVKYFDGKETERSLYGSSGKYVEELNRKQGSGERIEGELTELECLEYLKYVAEGEVGASHSSVDLTSSSHSDPNDAFIGQIFRLYLPSLNEYHVGRILDHRVYTAPVVSAAPPQINLADMLTMVGAGEKKVDVVSSGTVEFLVRFATGSGGRKVPVHRWLVLEEHCAAVGVAVVWGMPSLEGKGEVVVWPTHVLARTRLECASSAGANMDMLKLDGRKTKAGVKALSHFFGEDSACELPLNDCATSFFSPKFEAMRKTDNKILCVSMAMAQIELEEQRRVKAWRESQDENKRGYGGVVTEGTEANIRRALLKDVKEEREARYSGRDTVGKGKNQPKDVDKPDAVQPRPSVPPSQSPLLPLTLTITQSHNAPSSEIAPPNKKSRRYNVTAKTQVIKKVTAKEINPTNISRLAQQRER